MNKLITAACFMFAFSPLALAQDKAKPTDKPMAPAATTSTADKPMAPATATTPAAKPKAGMSDAKTPSTTAQPKKEPSAKQLAHQEKMKSCNKEATAKSMKGSERKTFMSTCLKG